jgi:hypothetical protein
MNLVESDFYLHLEFLYDFLVETVESVNSIGFAIDKLPKSSLTVLRGKFLNKKKRFGKC